MNVKSRIKQVYWRAIQSRLFDSVRPRMTHTPSFLLQGKTKTNCDLSISVFASQENIVRYLSRLAYSEEPQIKTLGNITYHKIPSIITDTSPDIVLAEFNEGIFSDFFLSEKFLLLPRLMHTLDISPPWETIFAGMRRIRRRNIRQIEKSSYTYEVTRDPGKFNFFYHKMYLPFISKTPADIARPTPVAVAKEWFLKGELLFVKSNDEYVSGILYHPENNSLHCRLVAYGEGIACQAGLHSLIQQAKEKGYTKINYGDTSPFMNDGLFYYKKSWGMKIEPNYRTVLALKFLNFGKAVQDFLTDNPFIFADFKNLIGLVLSNSHHIDPESLCGGYHSPGLCKLVVFYQREKPASYCTPTSEDFSPPTLRSVDSLIKLASETNFDIYLHDFST